MEVSALPLFVQEEEETGIVVNVLEGVTDLILAIGTNDIRRVGCDPKELACRTHQYAMAAIKESPSLMVFLPAVIPTRNEAVNEKIDVYNHCLVTMSRQSANLEYVHMGGLGGQDGLLLNKFTDNNRDNLGIHLNTQGLSIYASRLKAALRANHYLPVYNTRRPASGSGRGARGSGGTRGRGSPRGRGSDSSRGRGAGGRSY